MTDHRDDETQFWETPEWVRTGPVKRVGRRHGPASFERTRSHRVVRFDDPPPGEMHLDDDRRAGNVGIDPVLVRIGAVGMVGVLMIPIALALREDPGAEMRVSAAPGSAEAQSTIGTQELGEPSTTVVTIAATALPTAAAPVALGQSNTPAPAAAQAVAAVVPTAPPCAGTYTVIANDFWNRFPKSSGATAQQWLNANGATADTPLYVGDQLCIPAGATAPAPPPPTTSQPPATTASTSPPPPTTQIPATTQATTPAAVVATTPTTRAPVAAAPPVTTARPAVALDPAAVEAIIREVWPDDIEERAVAIARRESGLRPYVHNYCCYGVFAIYFEMGRNFLPGLGITSADQLFDARTNIRAAYHLYTIAGWAPWVQTDPG